MEVRLIRHFATEGNLEKRYIGVTDEEIKTECVPEYILKKEENRRYGKKNGRAKWEPELVAEKIREVEKSDINLKGRTVYGIADPAIFADDRGKGTSIAAVMERQGGFFSKGNHERLSGKMQMHNRLRFDENGVPMFYVFSTCKSFIRTVPSLVYSETAVEDVDTKGEDHIYDECRYVLMEYPISPPPPKEVIRKEFDPLATDDGKKLGNYEFYRSIF